MNYLLIIITILFLCVLTYLSLNHKEPFITYIKDKQLIGTIDRNGMEDNRYPLSSYRNNEKLRRNEEICYGTLNVKPNTINPNDRGLCPKNGSARHKGSDDREYKILEGERTPTLGMHAIDFSNYETYYEREIKGKPLEGQITAGNMVLKLSSSGRAEDKVMISNNGKSQQETSKRFTLSKAKRICDELGSSCAGFTVFTPTEDNPDNVDTIFYETVDQNSSDIYSLDYEFSSLGNLSQNKDAKYLKNNPGAISYIKKNAEYVEKPVAKLDLGSVRFTKLKCNVKQNDYLLYHNMNGTVDSCKAKCMTFSNPDCIGFTKDIKQGEDSSSACYLHKGDNVDYKNSMITKSNCPVGFVKKTDADHYCAVSDNNQLSEDVLKNNCTSWSGTVNPTKGKIKSCVPKPENTEKICLDSTEFATYKREYD
jgi:hypothetical protein